MLNAEFDKEKLAVIDADLPKQIDTTLPGWGAWAGPGVKPSKKRRHQHVTNIPGVAATERKDRNLSRVIISERKDKRFAAKYLTDSIPHPYKTRQQYEAAMSIPLGAEWNTQSQHRRMTKPTVSVRQGVVIKPLKYVRQPDDKDELALVNDTRR